MKERLKFNSLKKKTILFVFIVTALCTAISAFIVSQVVEDQMMDEYEIDKEATVESLSYSLVPMLGLYDYKQVERAITSYLTYESVVSIAVFDDSGTLIRLATKQNVSIEDLDVKKCNITSNDKVIGSFEIGFSKGYITKQIHTTIGALVFGLMGFFVLLGLLLYTFMSRSIINPLEAFTETIKEMDPENLSMRVKVHRKDEIGTLAASFNQMAENLEKSHRRLQKAYDNLEQKVKERTKKLSDSQKALVNLLEDLTSAKNELERANLQLEKASRFKSEFLANMSHELRTPLNSIIGFTSIILQGMAGEINEEQKKQLTMVHDSAKHLLGLISGLLDLSKIESGKMAYASEKFNIRDTIEDALGMVSPMIEEKGLKLNSEISEEVRYIYSDEKKVKQILINLLNNAVKFTDSGQIDLKCRILNNNIEISVSDTGIGIKKDNIEFIFDEFRQIDGTVTREYGGTGLGLSISKKFIEALGGSIWCESEYSKGSKFTFTIPLRR